VLILKRVKVLCFDTLLQVLILKGVTRRTEEKAAGLSGCCPDQAEDSALRYRPIRELVGLGSGRVFTQAE
jgi:hypothetical protein